MSIKFAARGISTQFRTPQELVETDGVTLKPTTGGEVLVSGASGVLVGTSYNATTGGCTVDIPTGLSFSFARDSTAKGYWNWSNLQSEPHTCDVVISINGVESTAYIKAEYVNTGSTNEWAFGSEKSYTVYSDVNATTPLSIADDATFSFVSMNGGYSWMASRVTLTKTGGSQTYADTSALNAAGMYVISDTSSAYDCINETSAGVGVVDVYAIEMLFYLRGSGSVGSQMSKSFTANDFWWTCVQNATDKATLEAFGLTVSRSNSYDTGFGMIDNNDNYTFEIIDLYTDNGITSAGADLSNFFVNHHHHNGETLERVSIDSIDAFGTACLTWKLRITKN